MTIAFVPISGLSFGPLRLFPIARSCSLRLFYVTCDNAVGKQIYYLFFLKAFLFILIGTFTAEAIGFLLSVLFLGVINKISYPFLNLLLLSTSRVKFLHGFNLNVEKVPKHRETLQAILD